MGGCLRLEGQMLRVNRSGACIHRGLEAAGAYPITFAQLVQAAEKCTAMIIHPGTPLNLPDVNYICASTTITLVHGVTEFHCDLAKPGFRGARLTASRAWRAKRGAVSRAPLGNFWGTPRGGLAPVRRGDPGGSQQTPA